MESAIINALPQLSVGVASVVALAYVCKLFLAHLNEREIALREVEREVRDSLTEQLGKNTMAMADMTRTHERVILALDRTK